MLAGAAGCAGSKSASPSVGAIRKALVERLDRKQLSYRWVACVRSGRRYKSIEIVRCNVNFGAPHIEVYCSILEDGRLVTNHENRAIPCGHDDAG